MAEMYLRFKLFLAAALFVGGVAHIAWAMYRRWRARRDADTDRLMRIGMRKARALGWLPDDTQ